MDSEKTEVLSIEPYELVQRIGQDAFVDTFLAYDQDSSRHVLISILNKKYSEIPKCRESTINRAYSLSQIRHPNLATIYSSGQTSDNQPYIVSEHIEGFSLADRLRRLEQQQSPAHAVYALTLIRQIASGLALAERLDYFHYELTPKHILLKTVTLKTDDSAVLLNLDMPFEFTMNQDPTEGPYSAPYLSPEQLNNMHIDGRSHVYSLGTILFQLLTGKLPDQNKPSWQLPLLTVSDQETSLRELRGDLAPETYALVEKALHKKPSRRHATVREFLSAIDTALAAEEIVTRTGIIVESRKPRPIYLAPLALLLVCLALATAMWRFGSGNSATESPVAESGNSQQALVVETMIASPSPASAIVKPNDSRTPIVEERSAASAVPTHEEHSSLPTYDVQPTGEVPVNSAPAGEAQPSDTPSISKPTIAAPAETEAPAGTQSPAPTKSPTEEPTGARNITSSRPEYRITVNSANLRLGPGTVFASNGYLLQDETVTIIGKDIGNDLWYVVEAVDGRIGWISATVGERLGGVDLDSVEVAATIPAPPTLTPRPTNTPRPPNTPTPNSPPAPPAPGPGGGSGLGN